MLVVCLGEDAIRGSQEIAAHLFRLWPQYKQELQFLGVRRTAEELAYFRLGNADDSSFPLSPEQVNGLLTGIFSEKSHFSDKNRFCIYYILDTTGFASDQDFETWANAVLQIKRDLGVDALDTLDMLVLQLNEDFARRSAARRIRNRVAAFYTAPHGQFCRSIFLLSNKRNDNTLLEEWGVCCRIIADVIALSNNTYSNIPSPFFAQRVFTVSYAYKEKPSQDIGQVIVEDLIDKLSELIEELRHNGAAVKNLLNDKALPSRLGLTEEKTLTFLDEYVDSILAPHLPGPEQLEHFPRRDNSDYGPMCDLSAAMFNEVTMNAWNCYLSQLASQMCAEEWEETYAALLAKNFFVDELLFLGMHLDAVRDILSQANPPYQEERVLDAAPAKLKAILSSAPAIIDTLLETIQEQSDQARAFVEARTQLFRSRDNLFPVTDDTIRRFYTRRTRDYFDQNKDQLEMDLRRIREIGELVRFLKVTINRIIDSTPVFHAPFEEEFEARLRETNQPYDAKQYIRQQLTADDVYTYLQMNFGLGEQLLSAILLKVGTPLYENLRDNLEQSVYYYNTGDGNMAEAVVVYEVNIENLISNEGES